MFMQILVFMLFSIVVVILCIDLIPLLKDWIRRIHIGRHPDIDSWNKSIVEKGIKWLNRTPKIKVTDNTRLVIIDILKRNYTKNTIQHWQEAALLMGVSEYLKDHHDNKAQKAIKEYLHSKFDKDGRWIRPPKNIDAAILAYAVMKLDFLDTNQYKLAFDYIWKLINEHIGEDGTVEYRKVMKSYRYVDTVGFICPFLVSYGTKYQKEECIELAIKQIQHYEQYGMSSKGYLPAHSYHLEHNIPIGLFGWGRGLGWLSIGLIDSWRELSGRYEDKLEYKTILEDFIKKIAKSIISYQQDKGNWNWTVTRKECMSDSSTTATLGWFLLNAAKIEDIAVECLASAEKAIGYLMKVTRRDGSIDLSQGDTKDIGVYSTLFNILPFTQGFGIRLINLYLRIEKSL